MIVSDASGQMGDLARPVDAHPGRGRPLELDLRRPRARGAADRGALPGREPCCVHLRKGLPARGISPLGLDGKPLARTTELGTIDYQVAPQVQDRLARVRTDLDSFSEVEAYSLSLYGYLMACRRAARAAAADLRVAAGRARGGGAARRDARARARPISASSRSPGSASARRRR